MANTKAETMTRTMRGLVLGLLVLGASAARLQAQTTLNNTTLTTSITDLTTRTVVVASTTNVAAGGMIFIDREAMNVLTVVNSTTLTVIRGARGTRAAFHTATGCAGSFQCGVVFLGPADRFKTTDPDAVGYCVRSEIDYLPWVNISTGNVWSCIANTWRGTNVAVFTYNSIQTAQWFGVSPRAAPTLAGWLKAWVGGS